MTPCDDRTDEAGVVRYDWTGEREPSTAVVRAVAAATDSEVAELASLGGAIDVDALNGLLDGRCDSSAVAVSFDYEGVGVVAGERSITIHTRSHER